MKSRLIITLSASILCLSSLWAQDKPVVGFALEKHMGPVVSCDLSLRNHMMVSVAKDHTMMVWDYPSYRFKKSVNLPGDDLTLVSYGVCAILPSNPDIVLIAEDSGDSFENDQYRNRIRKRLQIGRERDDYALIPSSDEREGFFYNNPSESIQKKYSFIAVDIGQGKVIDRVGSLSSRLGSFVFSKDESLLLAVTEGEEAVLFETKGLRQVSQFILDDEKILEAFFLTSDEIVFLTDVHYFKFRIHRKDAHSVVEKELLLRRRLKRGVELFDVKVNQSEGKAYVFHRTKENRRKLLGETKGTVISLEDGRKLNESLEEILEPTPEELSRKAEATSVVARTIVTGADLNGKEVKLSQEQRENILRELIRMDKAVSYLPDEVVLINTRRFLYRSENAASIQYLPGGFEFAYPDRVGGSFDREGVHFYTQGREILIKVPSRFLEMKGSSIYIPHNSEYPQIIKTGKENPFKKTLPIDAVGLSEWVNEHHFLAALADGTIRWYNMHTGDEELAIFVSKEGHYVIWSPDGRYDSDDDVLAAALEWRFIRFSNIDTEKPVDKRLKYFRPNHISRQITQLYDPEVEVLSNRYAGGEEHLISIDRIVMDSTQCSLSYSLKNYNPVKYGPFDIGIFLDEEFPVEEYKHFLTPEGGTLVFSVPEGAKFVDIELVPVKQNQDFLTVLSSDTKLLREEINPTEIVLTSVGVNDYGFSDFYSDLSAPINDSHAVKTVFENLPSRSLVLKNSALFNENVTSERLRQRIDELKDLNSPGTLSVFFFSGHGDIIDGRYKFVSDQEFIDIAELLEYAEAVPGYKLFIFDTCYSGASQQSKYEKTAILASSDAVTKSTDGTRLRESPFTKLLVDVLRSRDKMPIEELYRLLQEGSDSDGKPQLFNNIGNINIVYP